MSVRSAVRIERKIEGYDRNGPELMVNKKFSFVFICFSMEETIEIGYIMVECTMSCCAEFSYFQWRKLDA